MNSNSRIVTIGGGTGGPTVVRALVRAGFKDIKSICASMDSGGKTGIIRTDERDRVIAISDLLRTLLTMISPKQNHKSQVNAFIELASFTDGRSRNLGYNIYYALLEKYSGNFLSVQDHLERLLGIKFKGIAIPVTTHPTNIAFKTESGTAFRGEHELDHQSLSANFIDRVWLEPSVPATPEAITAIKNSTHIIYCPGSIYGSVISNLLPLGVSQALKKSKAEKILITNLVSTRNQTHNFTPTDFLRLFRQYTGLKIPFDTIIIPDINHTQFDNKFPKAAAQYALEHSHFLGWEESDTHQLLKLGIKVIRTPIYSITSQMNRIRHDPEKLGTLLKRTISIH